MNYIKWYGADDCPIDPNKEVQVYFRNGKYENVIAGDLRWSHFQDGLDIVEYRILRSKQV